MSLSTDNRRVSVAALAGVEQQGRGSLCGGGPALGLQDSLSFGPHTVQGSHHLPFVRPLVHQGQSSGVGSALSCQEGSSGTCSSSFSRVFQPIVCGDEGLRVLEGGHRPFAAESEGAQDILQDGDSPVCPSLGSVRGLDGFSRLEGCLLAGVDSSGQPQVPQIPSFWPSVPVQGAVLWSLHGSSGLYQSHGPGFDLFTPCWYPHPPLPGREASLNRRRIPILRRADSVILVRALGSYFVADSSGSGRSTQDALPSTASSSFLGPSRPVSSSALGLRMLTRPRVVVRPVSPGRRSFSVSGVPQPRLLVRRLGRGLGGTSGRQRGFRPLVSSRCGPLNQRQRASGGGEGSAPFCSAGSRLDCCSGCGQLYCCCLPAQSRGNSVSSIEHHYTADSPVGRVSSSRSRSAVHHGEEQCLSRRSLQAQSDPGLGVGCWNGKSSWIYGNVGR